MPALRVRDSVAHLAAAGVGRDRQDGKFDGRDEFVGVQLGLRGVAGVNGYTRDQDMAGGVAVLDDLARSGGVSVLRGDPQLADGLTVAALRRLAGIVA